ncbi:MAG: hypothetical protein Q4G40_06135 [Brachybacterium sp.]|nr:hypothetical protein [Brachybacterium sp.]
MSEPRMQRRHLLRGIAWSTPAVLVATTAPAMAVSPVSMDIAVWQTNHHLPAAAGSDSFRVAWTATPTRPTIGLRLTLEAYEVYKAATRDGVDGTLTTSVADWTIGPATRTRDTAYRAGVAQPTSSGTMRRWTQTLTIPAGRTSPGEGDFSITWPDRNGVNGSWQYRMSVEILPSPIGETADDRPENNWLVANRSTSWVRTEPLVERWRLWDAGTLDTSVRHRQYGSIPTATYPSGYRPDYTAPTLGT